MLSVALVEKHESLILMGGNPAGVPEPMGMEGDKTVRHILNTIAKGFVGGYTQKRYVRQILVVNGPSIGLISRGGECGSWWGKTPTHTHQEVTTVAVDLI